MIILNGALLSLSGDKNYGGIEIGNGANITAGTLVNKNIPEDVIYAGVQAKKIKNNLR